MKNTQSGFAPVMLAVILGVLILGGATYFGSRNFPRPIAPPIVNVPTPTSVSGAVDNTSTWKTYRNEKYGFELQYPGHWYVNEVDPFGNITSDHVDFRASQDSISLISIAASDYVVPLRSQAEIDRCEKYAVSERQLSPDITITTIEENGCPWEESPLRWHKVSVFIKTQKGQLIAQTGNFLATSIATFSDDIESVLKSLRPL